MTADPGRKQVQWGVLIGRSVRPLPKARNVTDAVLYACHLKTRRNVKTAVVYRDSESETWRKWIDETPVPTQLALDLFDKEAQ
ncbi:hypothetical protein ACFYO1_36405 [Nocardia sp. NPDC006044]|uniref:hypothetical protein n=1 Tax=Nocardia sp. NPDC006044 TaxID=3364306 RepID=UPI003673B35F